MLFLFRSAPEVEKRIHSKLFRNFWRSRGTKEPAYITVLFMTKMCCYFFFTKILSMHKIATAISNELVFDNNQHTARALKEERQPQRARLGQR